jgi:periplasmic protein TonB
MRFACCLVIAMLSPACVYAEPVQSANEAGKAPDAGSISRSRTDDEIQRVFDKNKIALYEIYQRALRDNPGLQGKIVLKITIAPSGQVLASTVESSNLGDRALERKVAARIKLFDFGKSGQQETFSYPIDFIPR